jgi:hypothetical protein
MAGIYALTGSFIAWKVLGFNPDRFDYSFEGSGVTNLLLLSIIILTLAVGTALVDSRHKAKSKGEKAWNATSRRMLINMSVPLLSGGVLIIALIVNGLAGLAAPLTLLFYGLALYNAGHFTFKVLRIRGIVQIILGLANVLFIQYGLLFWIFGFGVIHIIYGIYMHIRYAR